MRGSCSSSAAAWPKAPPTSPPMTMDGAKSPALPPVPMVSDAASMRAQARSTSSSTAVQPEGMGGPPVMASCAAP